MAHIIRMPEVAAGTGEAAIQAWLVKPGDEVAIGQTLVEIETDKAVIDLDAEEAGIFAGTLVLEGTMVAVGTPIGVLAAVGENLDEALTDAGGSEGSAEAPSAEQDVSDAVDGDIEALGVEPVASESIATERDEVAEEVENTELGGVEGRPLRLFTSPLVRRLAKEHGLDLSTIKGSGPNGRILKKDLGDWTAHPVHNVYQVEQSVEPQGASVDESAWELIPHTGMRRAVARRLSESQATVPHFYVVADCRTDELLELRAKVNEQSNVKISVNDFILKAVTLTMGDVPAMNAIWSNEGILRAKGVDVAVAVSIEGGLLTPVVRGIDSLSMSKLATTTRDYAERARSGKLKQRELEGGTITVSNLGMYGTKEFSAIINPPHAAILAIGAASKRAVVVDDEILVASVMTVTLSADHRVVDGAVAAEWMAAFKNRIESPLGLLI